MNEVEHMSARVNRLEEAIVEVIKQAPQAMQEVIRGLHAAGHFQAKTPAATALAKAASPRPVTLTSNAS